MAVHLIKLCVGVDSVAELEDWIERRLDEKRRRGETAEHTHVTRMSPKRREELLDGGSIFWVIRRLVQCRQRLLDIRPVVDGEGITRCALVLEPQLVLVEPRRRDPFQGWRYLQTDDAPPDLDGAGEETAEMPVAMRRELAALGLL